MRKLFILFTFLCVSVVGFATDYCHSEMTAGGKTIYLTCQQISAGNYQLKVECNEAMSGLGGSFCEVNGVGGYQLNAAGHFDLSADGKTITCDIASSTAPRVYTPLYVLIDGEKNFGEISDASWAACGGGSTPDPDPDPTPDPDPNSYTAGGHTIHLEAYHVNDIYTLNITSTDNMEGLGGSFWNVNGVGADMRTNTGTSSYTVSGDKKTITCQVQSTSAPNIYTPLYVLMPGEVNFGSVTLNWEDRTPINSEYCNYQGSETLGGGTYVTLTWETDGSGNVVITMGNGTGTSSCSFRNGGFEGGINAFIVSTDDFVTSEAASNYFTAVQVYSGNTYTLTKTAELPANAKIKHIGSGHALAWVANGNNQYTFPDFIYTYGGTCNQLDAPTNVAIDGTNHITFDAVAGADSYTAYVSLGGVQKYSQVVASGDELTYVPLVTGDYTVNVVASGTGKVDSDPSADLVWHLEAAPVVLGNSEYCEHVMLAGDNREAAFTWETDGSGNIVITISATRGDAADTHFRGNGMALGNFKVGSAKEAASNYFNHACGGSNQVTLSLKNPAVAPALGEKIYFNQTVEYATSLDGDAWPTLDFEWTYGTVCSGKAVSATPNDNTMGTAVVQKAGVDVTNVDDGDEVSFIATSNNAELYRFVNWTKAGVEVSTSATYVTIITETTNLIANFEYIRNTYCHYEILSNESAVQGKKLYMTLGSIGGGKFQIMFEGSAEAPLLALNNANYTVNNVSTDIDYTDPDTGNPDKKSGNNVPFSKKNGRWIFNPAGYGSAKMEFSIDEGKTIDDIFVWNDAIYFATTAGELGYVDNQTRLGLFGNPAPLRHNIDWDATCADAEAPVFTKAEAEVLSESSVRLKIQATDNWEGILTYTIARAGAEPIISNHASSEEFAEDVTGLTAGTEYDFTVTVSDGVNNANTHIVVTPVADNTKPTMGEASLESKTWNSAIINVAATDDKGVVAYRIVELAADFVPAEDKITVEGLTASTAYTFTIKAKDAAGNISDNSAEVSFTTDAHALVPQAAFSPAPSWPADQVQALYSPTYNADYNHQDWNSGTVATKDEFGRKYVTNGNGYFGADGFTLNCLLMEKLHCDIWIADNASMRLVPIYGGTGLDTDDTHGKMVSLTGQQWNSIDLDLANDFAGLNLSSIFQFKIDNAPNLTFWIANVYFYRELTIEDDEDPTDFTASLAEENYFSVKINAQASDNSGAVTFTVKNGDDVVATQNAASAAATVITVTGLNAGTAYNLNVYVADAVGHELAPRAIAATTKALPSAAPVPTLSEDRVKSIYSNSYDKAVDVDVINFCEFWWKSPAQSQVQLAGNEALLYENLHADGSYGIAWDATKKLNAAGYQYLHFHIYPQNSGTIEVYPVIQPEEEFHRTSQTLVGGQWNEVIFDYSDKTFAPLNQIGFVNFASLGEYFIDNIYFFQDVPEKEVIRDGLSDGKWGTICPKQTVEEVEGATFYQISYLEEQGGLPYNMVFDEISGSTLTAGQPYFFIANGAEIKGNKTSTTASAGAKVNGFCGYISTAEPAAPMELTVWHATYDPDDNNTYVIHNNKVVRINQGETMLPSERCYININATEPERASVPQPVGRRRVTVGVSGAEEAQGVENIGASEKPMKLMINGQLFIIRGAKMYDATGRLVK